MFRRSAIGIFLAMAVLIYTDGFAQSPPLQYQPSPDSPIGVRNTNAPAELQQLEFLIGDWNVAIVLHRPSGDLAYEARWHNTWIVNGFAIMQEWRDPYSTGAELRTYNSETGRWEGRNFYTGMNTWTESEGTFANGEFVIETQTVGSDGSRLSRERYFDLQPHSFRMVATHSSDGGQTWSTPAYEMVCTRVI
ncbi:MAG: sialidase family protein [Terricaulis sp.]